MRQKGITLIELLVVVVIIAIISAIAIPLYKQQTQKSRRYDAQGVLMSLANVMEQDLAKTPNTGYTITDLSPYSTLWGSLGNFYTFSVALSSVSFSYTLTATPKAGQADDSCGTLTLTQSYVKGASTAGCWK